MRRIVLVAACALVWGCSENLGPAPPDGGVRVRVASESMVGPRTARTGVRIATTAGRVYVGTDAGVFGFSRGAPADWEPVHGAYLTVDGGQRVGIVRGLTAEGLRIFVRGEIAGTDALLISTDGGDFFSRIERPDALLTNVAAIGIAPAGALGASGAWIAVQGGRVFVRAVGGEQWSGFDMPRAPASVQAVAGDTEGRIVVAVGDGEPVEWTVWERAPGAPQLLPTGRVLDGPALALALDAGQAVVATGSGIRRGEADFVRWPGSTVIAAAVAADGADPSWALVSDGFELAQGRGAALPVERTFPLPAGTIAGVSGAGQDAVVLYADASLATGSGPIPYRGAELDLSALATAPAAGRMAVGHFRTGEIYEMEILDPDSFVGLGSPLRASVPRRLFYPPDDAGRLWLASFGLYETTTTAPIWQPRNEGFFSYDPTLFGGPFPVSELSVPGDGAWWAGGVNGEGPYRSLDGGSSWSRVHEGLGEPGSYLGESGLPLLTQVHGFARDGEGRLWMGGFRGGAFVLDVAGTSWQSASVGLPLTDGAPLEVCCPAPGEAEVDVRDLLTIEDGALLAATGWGTFRRRTGDSRWEPASTGLFNLDVRELLRHPADSATVLAACAARPDSPDWLFLTRDAGRTWFPVDSRLRGRSVVDLGWSDPDRLEVVVLLEAQGVWRMELDP